jgi:hypothetical protein
VTTIETHHKTNATVVSKATTTGIQGRRCIYGSQQIPNFTPLQYVPLPTSVQTVTTIFSNNDLGSHLQQYIPTITSVHTTATMFQQ